MPLKSCERMRQQLGVLAFATVAIWACASASWATNASCSSALIATQLFDHDQAAASIPAFVLRCTSVKVLE